MDNGEMAKRRYVSDYDQVAYKAIALGGIDRAAYETLGIDSRTFYRWMGTHESFRDAVESGREFHRRSSPEALRLALITHIVQTLENGGEVIHTRQRTITRMVQRNRQNQVISITETEVTVDTDEMRGLPKWVADKIMANAQGLGEAIAKVINAGFEVHQPDGQHLLNGSSSNDSN